MKAPSPAFAFLIALAGCELETKITSAGEPQAQADPEGETEPEPEPDDGPTEDSPIDPGTLGPPPAQLFSYQIAPLSLDPGVDQYLASHFVYADARLTLRSQLVLHLAGKGGVPSGTNTMLKWAAAQGFRTIGLSYVNNYDIVGLCRGKPALEDCHGRLRLEALEGIDRAPGISVSPANSIEKRLVLLLKNLQAREPRLRWDAYLNGNSVRWEKIIVSGHSHGASAAGRIAKARLVARAVMLSGPYDNLGDGSGPSYTPATWVKAASVTPPAAYYGFTHESEDQHAQHLANWSAMNLSGAPQRVDGLSFAAILSHRLTTKVTTGNPHGSTSGYWVPTVDGKLHFDETFKRLFGAN